MRIDTITSLEETMLGIGLILLVLVAGIWLALSHRPHHYGGHYGIAGGLEGWQHSSYRWRRGLEAAALMAISVITVPHAIEVAVGAGLMALGLLVLAWWTVPQRRRRRLDVLACWPSSLWVEVGKPATGPLSLRPTPEEDYRHRHDRSDIN